MSAVDRMRPGVGGAELNLDRTNSESPVLNLVEFFSKTKRAETVHIRNNCWDFQPFLYVFHRDIKSLPTQTGMQHTAAKLQTFKINVKNL